MKHKILVEVEAVLTGELVLDDSKGDVLEQLNKLIASDKQFKFLDKVEWDVSDIFGDTVKAVELDGKEIDEDSNDDEDTGSDGDSGDIDDNDTPDGESE